jgi:hypothetical protein
MLAMLARQAHYHLSHSASPVLYWFSEYKRLENHLPQAGLKLQLS